MLYGLCWFKEYKVTFKIKNRFLMMFGKVSLFWNVVLMIALISCTIWRPSALYRNVVNIVQFMLIECLSYYALVDNLFCKGMNILIVIILI